MTDHDGDLLKAEVVALQAVMIAVFRRMANDRPDLSALFCQAFDEAEAIMTGVAVQVGVDAPAATTVGALRVLDEIRAGVLADPDLCRAEG